MYSTSCYTQCEQDVLNIELYAVSTCCRKWLPGARVQCLTTILIFQREMVVWKGNVVHAALKFVERLVCHQTL